MNLLILSALLIGATNDGYVLPGSTVQVDVQWAVGEAAPAAQLHWQLASENVVIAKGTAELSADTPAAVKLDLPELTQRTPLKWTCQATGTAGQGVLAEGAKTIHVLPPALTAELGRQLKDRRVTVIEPEPDLTSQLLATGVTAKQIKTANALTLAKADLILVAPGALASDRRWVPLLLNQAKVGAGVLVLAQKDAVSVLGFKLQPHDARVELAWHKSHPLLTGLAEDDLKTWPQSWPASVAALALPKGEAALEIAYWPPPAKTAEPVPLDVLLFEKQIGQGRLVCCQLPLGNLDSDPRAQLFLSNALRYIATRPVPTPPWHERITTESNDTEPSNEIKLNSGARP